MVPLLFTCPHCGAQTNVADAFIGRTGPCGSCGKTVTILPPGVAPPRRGLPVVLVVLVALAAGFFLIAVLLAALLLPAITRARESGRRAQCCMKLKQIGLGLLNYEAAMRHLPPVGMETLQGKPLESWRVAILPYIENMALFQQYDRSLPWNNPKNRSLAGRMPTLYDCPSAPSDIEDRKTHYVMICGKNTLGGTDGVGATASGISAGTSYTILVIEAPGAAVDWMDPRDLSIDEIVQRMQQDQAGLHHGGLNAVFCDGAVHFLRNLTPEALRQLADPRRAAAIDLSQFEQ